MFVRLFVDENLDRMVPISKQPKEKIQAIIDSCRRQFPEYQERARKRIRTYLKSCRRMKRSGFEMVSFDLKPSPSFHQNPICKSMALFCFHLSVFIFCLGFFFFDNTRSEISFSLLHSSWIYSPWFRNAMRHQSSQNELIWIYREKRRKQGINNEGNCTMDYIVTYFLL